MATSHSVAQSGHTDIKVDVMGRGAVPIGDQRTKGGRQFRVEDNF